MRRILALLAVLAVAIVVALNVGQFGDSPTTTATTTAQPANTRAAPTVARKRARAEPDSAERARNEALEHQWLGPQKWVATPGSDSTVDLIEATLADSTVADVMDAFVTIPVLRDSAGAIEVMRLPPAARLTLAGNVDSLVRAGVQERMTGCTLPLSLPVRELAHAETWKFGFVPGMVTLVPRSGGSDASYRADALRLFAALPDSSASAAVLDSVRGAKWSLVQVSRWAADDVELLVAHRRRASPTGAYEHFVEEQLVIAERPAGSGSAFTTVFPWHAAYVTEELNSLWVDAAAHVGPARRLAFLLGFHGYESGGGSFLVRSQGKWREAVTWTWGC